MLYNRIGSLTAHDSRSIITNKIICEFRKLNINNLRSKRYRSPGVHTLLKVVKQRGQDAVYAYLLSRGS